MGISARRHDKVDEMMTLCDELGTNFNQSDAMRNRLLDAILHVVLAPTMETTA